VAARSPGTPSSPAPARVTCASIRPKRYPWAGPHAPRLVAFP